MEQLVQYLSVDGILLCYGPLALTILGFIGFAALTDADARARYLRRLDLRTEWEAPEIPDPVVTEPVTARTPSGARVTIDPTTPGGTVKIESN